MGAFTYGRGKKSQNRFAKAMNKNKKIARRSRHINTKPGDCVSCPELMASYSGQAITPVVIEHKTGGNSDRTGAGRAVYRSRSMDFVSIDFTYRTGDTNRPEYHKPQTI